MYLITDYTLGEIIFSNAILTSQKALLKSTNDSVILTKFHLHETSEKLSIIGDYVANLQLSNKDFDGIVDIKSCFFDKHDVVIVYEYPEDYVSLLHYVENHSIHRIEVTNLAASLLRALASLHNIGSSHGKVDETSILINSKSLVHSHDVKLFQISSFERSSHSMHRDVISLGYLLLRIATGYDASAEEPLFVMADLNEKQQEKLDHLDPFTYKLITLSLSQRNLTAVDLFKELNDASNDHWRWVRHHLHLAHKYHDLEVENKKLKKELAALRWKSASNNSTSTERIARQESHHHEVAPAAVGKDQGNHDQAMHHVDRRVAAADVHSDGHSVVAHHEHRDGSHDTRHLHKSKSEYLQPVHIDGVHHRPGIETSRSEGHNKNLVTTHTGRDSPTLHTLHISASDYRINYDGKHHISNGDPKHTNQSHSLHSSHSDNHIQSSTSAAASSHIHIITGHTLHTTKSEYSMHSQEVKVGHRLHTARSQHCLIERRHAAPAILHADGLHTPEFNDAAALEASSPPSAATSIKPFHQKSDPKIQYSFDTIMDDLSNTSLPSKAKNTASDASSDCSVNSAHSEPHRHGNKHHILPTRPFSGQVQRTIGEFKTFVVSLCQLRDGIVAVGLGSGDIELWDLNHITTLPVHTHTYIGHTGDVNGIIHLQDGRLCSGAADSTVRLWDIRRGSCVVTMEGHTGPVTSVIQARDGRIVSGSSDKTLRLWSPVDGTCIGCIIAHDDWIRDVIQLKDGRLATASDDSTVRLWFLYEESEAHDKDAVAVCQVELCGHHRSVMSLYQLKDGRLVSGSDDRTIIVWDIRSTAIEMTLVGHLQDIKCVIELTDGRLCSGSWDNTMRLWDLSTGLPTMTLAEHTSYVMDLIQLKDGRILSCSDDKTIKIWI